MIYGYEAPKNHHEGLGSIFQRILFCYLYCESNKLEFGFSEKNLYFTNHFRKEEESEIIHNWSHIFNIFFYYKNKIIDVNVDFEKSLKNFENLKENERIKLINNLRINFFKKITIKKNLYKEKDESIVIAIHIRDLSKGDSVIGIKSLAWQYFSVDYKIPSENHDYYSRLYSKNINEIAENYKNQKIILRIHSTTNYDNLKKIIFNLNKKINVEYYLNERIDKTFIDMITCDVLIASHSSLSYLALFLNRNKKYIRNNFRHVLPYDVEILREVLLDDIGIFKKLNIRILDLTCRLLYKFKIKCLA